MEVLDCSKRTAYNKLKDYNTFTLLDVMNIVEHYGVDCNTAIATIIYSSNEYHSTPKNSK